MKKWVLLFSIFLVLFLISAGCSKSETLGRDYYPQITTTATQTMVTTPMYVGSAKGGTADYAPAPTIVYDGEDSYQSSNGSWSIPETTIDRMVIRTGDMQLVVADINGSLDNIVKIASDNGGYVVSSQKWKDNERNYGFISIRILAENYEKTLAALRSLAVSVTSETTSSQDVTEEYTDLTSKLKNLEAAEAQLLKIMENATETEDVLAVQRELVTIRGDIEVTKGRMIYIERSTSTSLINIQLNESIFGLKFSADKVMVNTNETVTFNPEITGGFAPFNYQWTFGDGDRSTEAAPQHVYKKGGDYTVILTVTDDKGYSNQVVRQHYINVQSSWNAGSVVGGAWNALKVFAKAVANVLITLAIWSPVWIIVGAIVWVVLYLRKRRHQKAADKKAQSQDDTK